MRSHLRYTLGLILIALFAASFFAVLLPVPGYMDADYYYSTGREIATGGGFWEPFLWNYLDSPDGLPHPSHTYWMPLPSILAAFSMLLTQSTGYLFSRLIFIILTALLVPITITLSFRISHNPGLSLFAGALVVFPGFYVIFLTGVETFALYMVLGSLFLLLAFPDSEKKLSKFEINRENLLNVFLLGIVAGLLHMTRADGLLWLPVGGLVILFRSKMFRKEQLTRAHLATFGLCAMILLCGYALITAPWYLRNLTVLGRIFPDGGTRTLWLTNYNQTFIYPAYPLNIHNWISMGWAHHLGARWDAFVSNLKNTLGTQFLVVLLPLVIVGTWQKRRDPLVWSAWGMWLLNLFVMTVIFPYSGSRGGFFHSGAALQPFFWALVPLGLETVIKAGARLRGWNFNQAWRVFSTGLLVILAAITFFVFFIRVIGREPSTIRWRDNWDHYQEVEQVLIRLGVDEMVIIMVNNPPGYFASTGRSAIVVPDGDVNTVIAAAERYGAVLLLLEKGHPDDLRALYQSPGDQPGLEYITSVDESYLFFINIVPNLVENH